MKRHRRRAPRRRWPGWREEVAGQFAALLPDGVWDSVHHLQRGILWAARAMSATQRRSSRWTPYDEMERRTSSRRGGWPETATRGGSSPSGSCKSGHTSTGGGLRNKLSDLTAQKKSAAKAPALAGIKGSGQGTAEALREDFRSFWAGILAGDSKAPLHEAERLRPSDDLSPADRAVMSSWDFESSDTLISHVDFLSIVMCTRKGKVGGSDGVLGEYLTVMSADQLGMRLTRLAAARFRCRHPGEKRTSH